MVAARRAIFRGCGKVSQFGKFVGVGIFNTALGYAVIFFLMYGLGWGPFSSNVMGYAIGLSCSYFLNRLVTFNSVREKLPEMATFLAVFCAAYGANLLVLKLLIDSGANPGLSQLVAGVFYIAISFTANKFLVFR